MRACVETLRVERDGRGLPPARSSSSARARWASTRPNNPVRTAVIAWKWGAYLGDEALKNGIRAKISSFARHHINVSLAKAKITGQYTNSVLAKREAKLGGYDEAILLDANGYVSEGSGENIFIVKKGVAQHARPLVLDPRGHHARHGHHARARDGAHGRTRAASRATSSGSPTRCSSPAPPPRSRRSARSTTARSATGRSGPITKRIQERFFDVVRGSDTSHPEWLTRGLSAPRRASRARVRRSSPLLRRRCAARRRRPRVRGAAAQPPRRRSPFPEDPAPLPRYHSKRLALSLPLPDGRAWRIDDHSRPELVATPRAHALDASWSPCSRADELVGRAQCEELARERRLVAARASCSTLEDEVDDHPADATTRASGSASTPGARPDSRSSGT